MRKINSVYNWIRYFSCNISSFHFIYGKPLILKINIQITLGLFRLQKSICIGYEAGIRYSIICRSVHFHNGINFLYTDNICELNFKVSRFRFPRSTVCHHPASFQYFMIFQSIFLYPRNLFIKNAQTCSYSAVRRHAA